MELIRRLRLIFRLKPPDRTADENMAVVHFDRAGLGSVPFMELCDHCGDPAAVDWALLELSLCYPCLIRVQNKMATDRTF